MTAKAQLEIAGMTCAACQSFIEKTLVGQKGVQSASVNLLLNQATVEFDPNVVSAQTLATTVSKTGYEATVGSAAIKTSVPDNFTTVWGSLAIGLVMMLAMPILGHEARWWVWTQMGLSILVMAVAGRRFYQKAWSALQCRTPAPGLPLLICQ